MDHKASETNSKDYDSDILILIKEFIIAGGSNSYGPGIQGTMANWLRHIFLRGGDRIDCKKLFKILG